ncbi:MAG: ATP-binding protein [Rhizobiaceae bacterium]
MKLISRKALTFTASVTGVCVALVSLIVIILYTFIIDRDVLFELAIAVPTTLVVAIPVTYYIGLMQDRLHDLNAELEAASKDAMQADRAKSEFLANMSHEIRTPMNGVMGMAELMMKTELTDKQRGFSEIILRSGNALLTIISDILDFSKIDAGQMELDPVPFRLRSALDDAATLVSTKVAEKDLELVVRVDHNLPDTFTGDVGRLRQIIINLLSNAIKFTERGHVLLNVDGSVSDGDATLSFCVEDTGIGIPAEKMDLIFDKFRQADESATRKHQGTGLGLAISSALIELMGGKLTVDSEVGVGSKFAFEITMPTVLSHEKIAKTPDEVVGSRILVVDDNSVNRSILAENLASWKFDGASVESGKEAMTFIDMARENGIDIDCIILDYHMPGMSGAEVARALRNNPLTAKIPIVMLTSVDQMEDGKTFSSLGIDGHLVKPARASVLLEILLSVLSDAGKSEDEIASGIANATRIGAMDCESVEPARIPA